MKPFPDDIMVRPGPLALALALLAPAGAAIRPPAPKVAPDRALQRELDAAVRGFRGEVGVYVRNLRTGRTASVLADSLFPTASMIKLPILVATFDAAARGALDLHMPLLFRDSLRYDDGDILGSFRDSTPIAPTKLVMLMLTMSDNTASLWLQQLAGTGTAINGWLAEHGFEHTRVNSRTPGREADRAAYGWGQTTPREIAELLAMIRERKAVSPGASEEMYRALTRSYWNGEALSQIPPWVQAASKQGMVNHSRSEVVLVNAPSGDYVFSVITKNMADSSWSEGNEGFALIRKVSAIVWHHFEPRHPWSPDPGASAFKPTEE
jgi:beta-lactamase class A